MLWFQLDYTEENVKDISSYYFFTMTFWVFDSMFTALTAFPTEREVILKERASGSYHLSAYFMAKTTADAPVRLILPFLYMTVSFWMAGFSHRFSVFIGTIGCTLLSVVSGEAFGLFIGAAIYDLPRALTIMTVITLALMLLGGFYVENVPSFIAWAKYLSPFKYAFDSSLQVIFDRPVPCDGSGALRELCANGETAASAADVVSFLGIQGSLGFNIAMLLVLGFLPRYGAYLALRMKKGGERS
jgi:ABC-type multidrug transport system permease subunit